MNTNRYVMASVAAGVFFFFYGFVVHTMILAKFWMESTPAAIYRPEGEEVMWAIALSCLLQAFVLGYIFLKNYEGKGLMEGVRFGVLIALFYGALQLLNYALAPVTLSSTFVGVIADGIGYAGLGAVFAMVYKPNA